MPSVSHVRRLATGAGILAMTVAALPTEAQAQAVGGQRTSAAVARSAGAPLTSTRLAVRRLSPLRLTPPRLAPLHAGGAARPARRSAAHAGRPRIAAVVPAQGAPGWPVTLSGSRLSHVTSVRFGRLSASFHVISAARVATTVPPGAASGRISVSSKAGSAQGPVFTVTPVQTLEPGETLASGESLMSKDRHFRLTMRRDGNLAYAVTGTRQVLWSSDTSGHPGGYLTLLANGNLVLYAKSGATTLWSTKTAGHGPARLVAQTNGNLTLYEGPTRSWTAGSLDNKLKPGQTMRPGWYLTSGTGYKLIMRRNGNLAETNKSGTVWSTATTGHPGATLRMRADGDLVLADGSTLWSSRTAGHKGARLLVQRSGVLAVRGGGKILWSSKRRATAGLTLGRWPGRAGPGAAARYYGYPYASPPACTHGGACRADRWAFYQGQCTSWVAYRVSAGDKIAFTNSYGGKGSWGNAVHWAAQARKLKIKVNSRPTVGAIAWYGSTKSAPHGHVAYVEKVSSRTSIVISEMNYDADNGFWVHTVTVKGDWPSAFIHLAR